MNSSQSPSTPSRIAGHARTSTVRQRLLREYGIDISKISGLTPDIVRESSLRLKGLGRQIKLATKFAQNAQEIAGSENQLEQIRANILKAGANHLKESDKLLGDSIMTNARLETSMQSRAAKLAGDLKIEKLKSYQGLQQQAATLQGQLRAMAATHDEQTKLIQFKSDQALKDGVSGVRSGFQDARAQTEYNRQLHDYINATDDKGFFSFVRNPVRGLLR